MTLKPFKTLLLSVSLPLAILAQPASAANKLNLYFGPAQHSVHLNELRTFSITNEMPASLRPLFKGKTADEITRARLFLSTRIDIDASRLSRLLYTSHGEALLSELGRLVRSESNLPGFYGLRAALVQAADESIEGITLLNVIEHIPGNAVTLNWERFEALKKAWKELDEFSAPVSHAVSEQQSLEIQALQGQGHYTIVKPEMLQTIAGDYADLYVPQEQGQYPVVVFAHGYGGDRESLAIYAKHLASHGYIAVVPALPLLRSEARLSTNIKKNTKLQKIISLDDFIKADWIAEILPEDFTHRPQAISRLLDELERRSLSQGLLLDKVDFQRVGVVGHSFGGSTALMLGGAEIDLQTLEENCPADGADINLSWVLQCQALGVDASAVNQRDARIKAVVAINPTSGLFGSRMAKVVTPTMIFAGGGDWVTPAVAEQHVPFERLTVEDRYLFHLENATHFSAVEGEDLVSALLQGGAARTKGLEAFMQETNSQVDEQVKDLLKAQMLAFFEVHLSGREEYRRFLPSRP